MRIQIAQPVVRIHMVEIGPERADLNTKARPESAYQIIVLGKRHLPEAADLYKTRATGKQRSGCMTPRNMNLPPGPVHVGNVLSPPGAHRLQPAMHGIQTRMSLKKSHVQQKVRGCVLIVRIQEGDKLPPGHSQSLVP